MLNASYGKQQKYCHHNYAIPTMMSMFIDQYMVENSSSQLVVEIKIKHII
jgi:hypothetical protein